MKCKVVQKGGFSKYRLNLNLLGSLYVPAVVDHVPVRLCEAAACFFSALQLWDLGGSHLYSIWQCKVFETSRFSKIALIVITLMRIYVQCTCTCTHTCAYKYMHTYAHTHRHAHRHAHGNANALAHVHAHTCTHMNILNDHGT